MKNKIINTLFLDIGGVLVTNGWGLKERNESIAHFKLDAEEVNERHHLTFDTYEQGKLSLDEYLNRIVFYEVRKFTKEDFIKYMFGKSVAFTETIDYFKKIKNKYHLRVIAVNNEGKELNEFRIKEFKLTELFNAFVSSCFVHLRKPDVDIFRMAIDLSQSDPSQSLYIDDRHMFVEVASTVGMHGIHFTGLDEVKKQLKEFNLSDE